jgi:hypothetical protein
VSVGIQPRNRRCIAAGIRATFVRRAAVYVVLILCCSAAVAEAHGGGPGLSYNPCMQASGSDDFIHLAVYQPEFNPFAEYCDAVPEAGQTLLVFDLMGTELPDAAVSVEVWEKGGRLQLSVPAQRYRSGVADLRADLPAGKYTVLVSLHEPGGARRYAFPLVVGAWWDRLIIPLLTIVVIALVTAGYCLFQINGMARERRNSATNNRIELRRVWKSQ